MCPAIWNGSKEDHAERMFYTEEWFSKPLSRYDNPELAIAYIDAVNDCVECYIGEKSITANTPEEVTKFFAENEVLLNKNYGASIFLKNQIQQQSFFLYQPKK